MSVFTPGKLTAEEERGLFEWREDYEVYNEYRRATRELSLAIEFYCRDENKCTEKYGPISEWDVSNVTSMCGIFASKRFNGDISKWDMSKVTCTSSMFYNSTFNGDISQWDMSNVTDMRNMFASSGFNGDISGWNVSKVIDMSQMFKCSQFNGDISRWDVSNVMKMNDMFSNSQFNGDISKWNVTNVRDMKKMFASSKFNGDISQWDVSKVHSVEGMFTDTKSFPSCWNFRSIGKGFVDITEQVDRHAPWTTEVVPCEDRYCSVLKKKIEYSFLKCGACERIYDSSFKEWLSDKRECIHCLKPWRNHVVYDMSDYITNTISNAIIREIKDNVGADTIDGVDGVDGVDDAVDMLSDTIDDFSDATAKIIVDKILFILEVAEENDTTIGVNDLRDEINEITEKMLYAVGYPFE